MHLAIWLVTLYPRAWRRRYEAEMLALLEQHRVTLLTVLDLLFGMIRARLDPQYRDDPGPVLFTSLPKATWMALAAWGAFVLCVAVASGPLYRGMLFLLTGLRDIPWRAFGGSILTTTGNPQPEVMLPVVGGNLWYAEPPIVLLAFFAMTALVSLGCLRWAVRTRRIGVIVLTTVWFAAPVAVILWLVVASHDMPGYLSPLQTPFEGLFPGSPDNPIILALVHFFSSLPVSLLTTLGELEALMGVVFLSVLRAGQALRTQRYQLLGLVAGVDLVLILIAVYIVKSWDLFTPFGPPNFVGAPLTHQAVQGFFTIEALGLCAHLLPFAAVALPLLALGGSAIRKQQWQTVILGVSLLAVLMAVCDVCFLVGMLIAWQLGEGIGSIPLVWAQGGIDSWYIVLSIPGEAIVATLVLALLVALRALRSMVAAGTTSAPAVRAPA